MRVDMILINKAYKIGQERGVSLSLGYFASPDGKTIFCQYPNSTKGIFVGALMGYGELPDGYRHLNMSAAISSSQN